MSDENTTTANKMVRAFAEYARVHFDADVVRIAGDEGDEAAIEKRQTLLREVAKIIPSMVSPYDTTANIKVMGGVDTLFFGILEAWEITGAKIDMLHKVSGNDAKTTAVLVRAMATGLVLPAALDAAMEHVEQGLPPKLDLPSITEAVWDFHATRKMDLFKKTYRQALDATWEAVKEPFRLDHVVAGTAKSAVPE